MKSLILAGDIGGTNTRLAFFESNGKRLKPVAAEVYPSRDHKNLRDIVERFVAVHHYTAERACFGIAGPVKDGRSTTSNLPWTVDERRLADVLKLKGVSLINDLEANAHGLTELGKEDFVILNRGRADQGGNEALISAGTGLGEAGLHWEGDYYQPFPSEGGHADFAPRNETEIELLRYLLKQYEHVSVERVLSGPGLHNIYKFLRDTSRGQELATIAEQMREGNPPSVILRAGLEGTCELCGQALDRFVSIYGAEAGNLALKVMATGGVFVGGGIAPRIIEKLKGPSFLSAFVAKGRLTALLESVPVRVIMNTQTALLGAARVAFQGVRPDGKALKETR